MHFQHQPVLPRVLIQRADQVLIVTEQRRFQFLGLLDVVERRAADRRRASQRKAESIKRVRGPEARKAEYRRARRRAEERVAWGLCARCGQHDRQPDRRLCAICGERQRRRDREAEPRRAGPESRLERVRSSHGPRHYPGRFRGRGRPEAEGGFMTCATPGLPSRP